MSTASTMKGLLRGNLRQYGMVIALVAIVVFFQIKTDGVLLRPLQYANPEKLVVLWESNPQLGQEQEDVSGATYLDWRAAVWHSTGSLSRAACLSTTPAAILRSPHARPKFLSALRWAQYARLGGSRGVLC